MPVPALLVPALLLTSPNQTGRILEAELAARPAATARDLYKLLHQSVFGPGHLILDAEAARGALLREVAGLGPTRAGEALLEDLGGGLVRVNLRPYRDAGGSLDGLLQAMVGTAATLKGDPRALDARIADGCGFLAGLGRPALAAELVTLAREQAATGHPPLRHAEAYRAAYAPAYRVVLAHLLPGGAAPGPPTGSGGPGPE